MEEYNERLIFQHRQQVVLSIPASLSYTEDADYTVIMKSLSYDAVGRLTGESTTVADGSGYVYKGALVFERNAASKLSLDAALTTGGRITAQKDTSTGAITGYTVHHHITDHLGSVRAVVGFAGNVLETSDFLPYGTRWSQTGGSVAGTLTDAANRWRYSGKEEQQALNSVIDEYKLFSRNCTTTVSDVLNSAGSSVLKGSTI